MPVPSTHAAESLPPQHRSTMVRRRQVNRIIGVDLRREEIAALLDPIEFTVLGGDEKSFDVAIPSWRPDSAEEIDVVEEVARHYGYENVPKHVPLSPLHGHSTPSSVDAASARCCLGLGISEVMPSPFLSDDELGAGLDGDVLQITNPLVADEDVLRRRCALASCALSRSTSPSASRRSPVRDRARVPRLEAVKLPDEREMLGVVLAGAEAPAAVAVWRELATSLGVGGRIDQGDVPPASIATRSGTMRRPAETDIGAVGEVAPEVLEAFDIDERVAVLELDLVDRVGERVRGRRGGKRPAGTHRATSTSPSCSTTTCRPRSLEKAIRQGAGNLLVGLELFDVYRGPAVAAGTAASPPATPAGARPHAHRRRHGGRGRSGPHGRRQARRRAARDLDRRPVSQSARRRRQFQAEVVGAPRRASRGGRAGAVGRDARARRRSAVNTSDGSESTTIQEPDSISASSWPASQPA